MPSDPIVVGTDGSPSAELAVDRAGELGEALDACVHVVSAYSVISPGEWMAAAGGIAVAEWSDAERAQLAETITATSRERLTARGISVRTRVCSGNPVQALVGSAADEHAQTIVVGNRGMTGARRVLGSVPNGVSHQARCGVLIVQTRSTRSRPGGAELTGAPIVVGTDGSDRAGLAVTESIRLAKALRGELHITLSYKGLDVRQNPDVALDKAAARARAEGVTAATHVSELDPAEALLDSAKRADAAMVVVGSKGMHGMDRLTLGSVPNQISHSGLCNVLIVYTGEPKAGSSD